MIVYTRRLGLSAGVERRRVDENLVNLCWAASFELYTSTVSRN